MSSGETKPLLSSGGGFSSEGGPSFGEPPPLYEEPASKLCLMSCDLTLSQPSPHNKGGGVWGPCHAMQHSLCMCQWEVNSMCTS